MQVILNSPFARPGSVAIGGGKKGEFRDWTSILAIIWNEAELDQQNSTCILVDSNAERIIKLCAYCLFGNVFIIIIVYRNRALRKTIDYFIVNLNLAFSGLFFPLIVLPVKVTEWVTESLHWHVDGMLGSIFCKLFYFASSVSLLVSAQSLVWIAIDRIVTVVFPIKLGLITSKIRSIAIVSTWVASSVFSP